MTHKEIAFATAGEIKDGEMRQVSAGGADIPPGRDAAVVMV